MKTKGEQRDEFPFAQWWAEVLQRDAEAERDEELVRAPTIMLTCVFCQRDLEKPMREAIRNGKGDSAAMLAWWNREGGRDPIAAAGLYCCGRDGCLATAEIAGNLLDVQAEDACGDRALAQLERIASDYPTWDGAALRRLTLILAALSRLPTRRKG
jgi:hypothetical protein